MDPKCAVAQVESKLAQRILMDPAVLIRDTLGMTKGLPGAEFERLVIEMYQLAVMRGNWRWVEQAQIEATLFFSEEWILLNIPHKIKSKNRVSIPKVRPVQEYVPQAPCKDFRLKSNPNLMVITDDMGNKELENKESPLSTETSTAEQVGSAGSVSSCDIPSQPSQSVPVSTESSMEIGLTDSVSSCDILCQPSQGTPISTESSMEVGLAGSVMLINAPSQSSQSSCPDKQCEVISEDFNNNILPVQGSNETLFTVIVPLTDSTAVRSRGSKKKTCRCPVAGCSSVSKHLKNHVTWSHLPKVFRDDLKDPDWDLIHGQRVEALELLTKWLVGSSGTLYDLCTLILSSNEITSNMQISQVCLNSMTSLAHFTNWPIPEGGFSLKPINSPACLIHWRCLAILTNMLDEQQKRMFCSKFSKVTVLPFKSKRLCDSSTLALPAPPQIEIRMEEVTPQVKVLSPKTNRNVLIEGACSSPTVPSMFQPETGPEIELQDVNENTFTTSRDAMDAIDSHMHLDRTCKRLGCSNVSPSYTVEDIIKHPSSKHPQNPIILQGAVTVYCDPENYPSSLPEDPRVKVAVGVHPKKIHLFNEERRKQFDSLITDPRVAALGEVGVDLTELPSTWAHQLDFLHNVIPLCKFSQPLVLHIRNVKGADMNPYSKVFEIVKEYCGDGKPIHLHCFSGTADDVQGWLRRFRNCYFGFTASVAYFSKEQVQGLKAVPLERILLETDSPYLPPVPGLVVNTPAFLGDVGELVADRKGVEYEDLMRWSFENTRNLYNFSL